MDRFHAEIRAARRTAIRRATRAAIRRAAQLPRRAIRAGKAALRTAYAAMRRCAHVSGWRRALPLLLCAVLLAGLPPHAKIPSGQTPGGEEPVFGPIHFVGSAAGSNPQRPYARRRRTAQTDTAVSSPSREMPAMLPVNTDAQPPASAVFVVAGTVALSVTGTDADVPGSDAGSVAGLVAVSGSVAVSVTTVSLSVTVVSGSVAGSVSVSVSFGRRDSL